ncbi:hypothetical protein Tco_1008936 [Tanacetum coccineum]
MDQRRAKMSSGSQNLNSNCKSKQPEVQCVRKWKAKEEPPIMSSSAIKSSFFLENSSMMLGADVLVFTRNEGHDFGRPTQKGTKSISNKAIARLVAAIKRLREFKIGRMQRLRKMIDLLIHASQSRSPHF